MDSLTPFSLSVNGNKMFTVYEITLNAPGVDNENVRLKAAYAGGALCRLT